MLCCWTLQPHASQTLQSCSCNSHVHVLQKHQILPELVSQGSSLAVVFSADCCLKFGPQLVKGYLRLATGLCRAHLTGCMECRSVHSCDLLCTVAEAVRNSTAKQRVCHLTTSPTIPPPACPPSRSGLPIWLGDCHTALVQQLLLHRSCECS